jgi:hypothetical protein
LTVATLASELLELGRVLGMSFLVDRARTREELQPLITRLRRRGQSCKRRDSGARSCLKRAVGRVDRLFPGGPNCFRRVLLEIALDAGAAEEEIYLALRSGGGPGTGHACLASDRTPLERYDAHFVV